MSLSFLRSLLITAPLVVSATVVMGAISAIATLIDPEAGTSDKVSRVWARMLLWLGRLRVQVQGLDRIDLRENYVFVGNHLSLMDTPVVLARIPVRFLFLANEKYFRIPFLGTHLRRAGHLPVVPEDVRASLKTMGEAARIIRDRRLSILLFPEGSRSPGELQEFKEGAAYIAIKSGVPVVPIAILGTREVLPIGSLHLRPGPVRLIIGDPIAVAGFTLKDRAGLNQLMRERVLALLERPAHAAKAS